MMPKEFPKHVSDWRTRPRHCDDEWGRIERLLQYKASRNPAAALIDKGLCAACN